LRQFAERGIFVQFTGAGNVLRRKRHRSSWYWRTGEGSAAECPGSFCVIGYSGWKLTFGSVERDNLLTIVKYRLAHAQGYGQAGDKILSGFLGCRPICRSRYCKKQGHETDPGRESPKITKRSIAFKVHIVTQSLTLSSGRADYGQD